jgi:hypothetical protein
LFNDVTFEWARIGRFTVELIVAVPNERLHFTVESTVFVIVGLHLFEFVDCFNEAVVRTGNFELFCVDTGRETIDDGLHDNALIVEQGEGSFDGRFEYEFF